MNRYSPLALLCKTPSCVLILSANMVLTALGNIHVMVLNWMCHSFAEHSVIEVPCLSI